MGQFAVIVVIAAGLVLIAARNALKRGSSTYEIPFANADADRLEYTNEHMPENYWGWRGWTNLKFLTQ